MISFSSRECQHADEIFGNDSTLSCAQKLLDTADIVREAILQQLSTAGASTPQCPRSADLCPGCGRPVNSSTPFTAACTFHWLTAGSRGGTMPLTLDCRGIPSVAERISFLANGQVRRKDDPMKRVSCICLIPFLSATFLLAQSHPVSLVSPSAKVVAPISAPPADPQAQRRILDSYGKLPLSFEANQGQTDRRVKFLSRTSGYSLFLTGDEAVLMLSGKKADTHEAKIAGAGHAPGPGMAAALKGGGVLRMKLRDANPTAKVTGGDELAGTSNYFIGNDPAKWRTGVPTYAKVKYEGIYSGIDLVYYGNERQLEYDFILAPGADPRRIAFDISGAKRIRKDGRGELVFKVGADEIRWHRPVVYQEKDGARQSVVAHYVISGTNRVGFEVTKYDDRRPLYIDPLIYSTYLGGSSDDQGFGIAVDSSGNAYVTGHTSSTDFPTKNPLQTTNGGGDVDAFVTKIDSAGTALVYSTYLGGSGDDQGFGIAVDSSGNAYVAGTTSSTDFPTKNPLQPTYGGGGDAFVTKISSTGMALAYSTYLGGSGDDLSFGIGVDSAGNAYVTGWTGSTDFPTTTSAVQPVYGGGDRDAFVSKINSTGSALTYSTYLGGSGQDTGNAITVDGSGNAYVTGFTVSTDFPTMNPLQATCGGDEDAFVTKINSAGTALVYSTYLGGSGADGGYGIGVDSSGNAYVTGDTNSTDFPTKSPLQGTNAGGLDIFVAKISAAGSALVYSTYLGGSLLDESTGIAVDSARNAYVTGYTVSSIDFPTTTNAVQPTFGGGTYDAFVIKLNPTGSALLYSSYLGGSESQSGFEGGFGIAVDSSGNPYVTGQTAATNFPTKNPLQPTYGGGGEDAFVAKTSVPVETPTTTTLSSSLNPSIYGQAVTFTAVVSSGIGAPPDGETITFMDGTTILGTGALSGGSASYTTSALELLAGTYSIKAVYGGDSKFLGSKSTAVSQVVGKATSTTTLASSRNPSSFGQSVTFTARVAPQFSGTPTGTVTFLNGGTVLATKALNGNGAATFSTSKLPLGSNIITAVYGGDSHFDSSTTAPVNQLVLTPTTTTLSSSLNPSIYGRAVTFTAVVTASLGAPPDGETVTFKRGATVLGTRTLSGGSASFTTSTLPGGTDYIKAVYGGDSNFGGSTSPAVAQVVSKATTTTTLVSSLNPSNVGQSVTFTTSITAEFGGTIKGSVTFYDGTTALKTASVSGGVAKITTSTLTQGTHTVTGMYNGNVDFDGSSASLTQTVN